MDIKAVIGIALLALISGVGTATNTPVTSVIITNDTVLARDYYATTFKIHGDNIDVSLGGHTLYTEPPRGRAPRGISPPLFRSRSMAMDIILEP